MSDLDLDMLKCAAEAAGILVEYCPQSNLLWLGEKYSGITWNPLHKNCDAFELAFKLGMVVHFDDVGSIEAVRRDITLNAARVAASARTSGLFR